MKIYYLKPFLILLLLLCCYNSANGQEHTNENVTTTKEDSKKVKELTALESEMINFFRETLEKNYGSKDAIDLLVKAMNKYYHIYILEVDKPKLQKINEKLYDKGWLYSYFLDGKKLDDSCHLHIPDSAKYMSYAPVRARMENLGIPLAMYKLDGFSYYQRELAHASRPIIKRIAEQIYATGDPPTTVLWGILSYFLKEFTDEFKSDRDTQMFMTLFCWKYLCHSANIDFYSGKDRTEMLLEEEEHK